jgi:superfamily II DNA/RNA helicase
MSFETLGLAPALLSAVQEAGFSTPTPVQASAIPQALAGHDLMVSSQTGSGKTAAFMLPALHRIAQMPANKGVGVQVLVLTPTRELALQVTEATATYGRKLADLRTATVVGGMPYGAQLKALSRRVDVLVATPGRLIDHLQSGRVKLNTVHTLVLDEADRMLDMGFIEDIETIVSRLPAERQTLLFSATLDGTIAKLAARMMRDPQRIEMAGSKEKHTNITQSLLYADDASHKMQLLDHVLRDASLDQAIVFTSTKRGADDLADRLADQGFAAAALHGDMNQRQRTRTLSQLQRGQLRILVATDVAARGIDVQGISHAVNFDLPMQAEDYVHRIGRTGRAGRNGLAFTLATHSERHKVRRIEHYIGQSITPEVIAGLEPKRTPRPSVGGAPRGGKPFGKRPGGFGGGYQGNRDGAPREGRSFGGPRGEFKPREGGYQGARDGAPREGGYQGNRPFGDRPARSFSDRPSFGDRPQREGGYQGNRPFGDRPPREGGFRGADRDARPSFSDRPSFGDRPQRDPRPFNERAPREGGFRGADRDARPSFSDRPSFGDRPQREGGFRGGDRPEGDFRGKPTFDKRPGGPAKRFAKPAGARRG